MSNRDISRLRLMRLAQNIDPKWITELSAFIRLCREENSLPPEDTLSAAEQVQRRIVADWLQSWQKQHREAIVPRSFRLLNGPPPKMRAAVFTSNMPGLLAAQRFFEPCPPGVAWLLNTEYDLWIKQKPDRLYESHWHFFCNFVIPQETWQQTNYFRKRFLDNGVDFDTRMVYWEQHSGTMIAGKAGHGEKSVWQWDGQEATCVLMGGWTS